jgi:hypothetical protein
MRKVNVTLNTDGCGYWSEVAKPVKVVGLDLQVVPCLDKDDEPFGELRVYFDTKTWNVRKDGLIYTDRRFERELKKFLNSIDLAGKDVEYSEQGMQGANYVSLDVGEDFINSYA